MSTTYSYSIVTDFSGAAPNTTQLHDEIDSDLGIAPECTIVLVSEDDVSVVFDSALSAGEKTILDGLVLAHTATVPVRNVIKIGEYGQYATLTEAIAAEGARKIYIIEPGTYIEDNPITVPAESSVQSSGTLHNTVLKPLNPTANLLNISPTSYVRNLCIAGCTGTASQAIHFDGTLGSENDMASLEYVRFVDCYTAIHASGAPGKLLVGNCQIEATTGTVSAAFDVEGGCKIVLSNNVIKGTSMNHIGVGVHASGSGTTLDNTALIIKDCNIGICIDDDAVFDSAHIECSDSTTAIEIGAAGTTSTFKSSAVTIRDSATYDIDIGAEEAFVHVSSGSIDPHKINNPNGVTLIASFHVSDGDRQFRTDVGDMRFGMPSEPGKLAVGEGFYNMPGYVIMSNDNLEAGTWVDNTATALTDGAVFDLLQGVTAGNACYLGADNPISGFKANIKTATVAAASTDIIWEYWDGSAWLSLPKCSRKVKAPWNTQDLQIVTTKTKHQVYCGLGPSTTLGTKSLNGFERYWVRFRIAVGTTTIPRAEYFRLHVNNSRWGKAGYMEMYGNARTWIPLDMSFKDFTSITGTTSQDLYLGDNLNLAGSNNTFPTGLLHSTGATKFLPTYLDTSFPLKFVLFYAGSVGTAGEMRWIVRWGSVFTGGSVYHNSTDAPTTGANELSITSDVTISAADTVYRLEAKLDVQTLDFSPDGNVGDLFWINIARDGTATEDTYSGDVSVLQVGLFGVNMHPGADLDAF